MMKRLIIPTAVVLSILTLSCRETKERVAQELIQEDTLVTLLVDLYLADATHVTGSISDAANTTGLAAVRTGVLEKHHVPVALFKETMRYYSDHPDELVAVYDNVIDELTRRQGRAPR